MKPSCSNSEENPAGRIENDEESIQKAKRVNEDREFQKEVKKREASTKIPQWRPPLPFPQRFQKKAFDEQYKKFLDIFKQLHINIPFIEALEQMPKYAKYLKEMLSKKKHFTEFATVALTKKITSVIKPNVPLKCKDPGSFTIPCVIGNQFEGGALCDLGSAINLMPLSLFKKLQLGEACPRTVTLKLADQSLSYPYGIIKDVLVKVGSFIYPADFIVLDMDEDQEIPLIVGRPFLATARALVDVEQGEIILRLGDEQVKFKRDKAMESQNEFKQCAKAIVINDLNQAKLDSFANQEPLKTIVIEQKSVENTNRNSGQIAKTFATSSGKHWHRLSQPP